MQTTKQIYIAIVFCVLSVWGAPTGEKRSKGNAGGINSRTETDLEKLAGAQAEKLNNAVYEKSKSFSYSNVNGNEQSKTESENKVINGENGQVIADIKQKEETDPSSADPKSQTEIDVPIQGIHEIFAGDGTQEKIVDNKPAPDYTEAFQYTPTAVAEYLVQTNEFKEFDEALTDLVNSSIMTEQQAVDYKENVRKEFNRLVQQQTNGILTNEMPENMYPVPYDLTSGEFEYPGQSYDPSEDQAYRGMSYANVLPHLGIEELESKGMMQEAITRATSLMQLIKGLMDEWLTRAIVTGDPEAERLLSDILKEVSKDNDPDDLSQLRETLYDFFANEVLESLERRPKSYEDYSLLDGSSFPTQDQATEINENKTEDKAEEVKTSDEKDNSSEDKEDKSSDKEEMDTTNMIM